jgi:hypothetical protein
MSLVKSARHTHTATPQLIAGDTFTAVELLLTAPYSDGSDGRLWREK